MSLTMRRDEPTTEMKRLQAIVESRIEVPTERNRLREVMHILQVSGSGEEIRFPHFLRVMRGHFPKLREKDAQRLFKAHASSSRPSLLDIGRFQKSVSPETIQCRTAHSSDAGRRSATPQTLNNHSGGNFKEGFHYVQTGAYKHFKPPYREHSRCTFLVDSHRYRASLYPPAGVTPPRRRTGPSKPMAMRGTAMPKGWNVDMERAAKRGKRPWSAAPLERHSSYTTGTVGKSIQRDVSEPHLSTLLTEHGCPGTAYSRDFSDAVVEKFGVRPPLQQAMAASGYHIRELQHFATSWQSPLERTYRREATTPGNW